MKIAFCKKDITPDRPCHMAGYNRPGQSTGVLDPIEINAVAMEIEGQTYAVGILDSIILEKSFCSRISETVSADTGIDAEHITVSAIHTHSAPSYFKLTFEDNVVETDLTLQAQDAMVSAIEEAAANLTECRVVLEQAEIEGLYGNRNIKNGTEDKQVSLFSFFNKEDSLIGAVFHISAHPTILNASNTMLSADLLGHIRAILSQKLACPVAILNGCCGDVSTRFYRTASGLEELTETARAVADQFFAGKHTCELKGGSISDFTFSRVSHFDAQTDPDLKKMKAEIADAKDPMSDFFRERLLLKESFGAYDLELIAQLRLCGNLLFIILPGDVLSKFGQQIKNAFPDYKTVIICYSNTYCNYLVPEDEYGRYFETYNTRLARGEADAFIDEVIKKARKLIADAHK